MDFLGSTTAKEHKKDLKDFYPLLPSYILEKVKHNRNNTEKLVKIFQSVEFEKDFVGNERKRIYAHLIIVSELERLFESLFAVKDRPDDFNTFLDQVNVDEANFKIVKTMEDLLVKQATDGQLLTRAAFSWNAIPREPYIVNADSKRFEHELLPKIFEEMKNHSELGAMEQELGNKILKVISENPKITVKKDYKPLSGYLDHLSITFLN